MVSEIEEQAIEDIKNIVADLEDTEDGAIISLLQDEIDSLKIIVELIEKRQKETEELKDTLKCIQNSWYKDTKVIETQQKEIKELEVRLQAEKKYAEGLNNDIKSLLNIEPNNNFISKDKIREKMREIMAYTFTTSEERHHQNYAYDRLKELLEE